MDANCYALFGDGDAGVLVPCNTAAQAATYGGAVLRSTQARRLLPYVQEYTQDGHMLLAGIPTTVALPLAAWQALGY